MKTRIDPLTGLEIAVAPKTKEFWVLRLPEFTPPGNQALGIGVALSFHPTRAQAIRYQLAEGVAATTYIKELNS